MPDTSLVLIGEITAPFGVRGEVKVAPLLDDPAYLKRLPGVILQWDGGVTETRRVLSVRRHQDACVMTFEGITDRNGAERLRGARLFLRPDELPGLEADTYYEWQLVGLRVVTESGKDLGKIEKVHFYPANDVYETPVALIPAVGDIVIEVALDRGEMRVRDIPGLRKDEG
jgi:16S rRNA processing protein RimM